MAITLDGSTGIDVIANTTGDHEGLLIRNGSGASSGQTASIAFETSSGALDDPASRAAKIVAERNGAGTTASLYFQTAENGVLAERMRIDSAGRVTMPYQPAFYYTKTSTQQASSNNEVINWDSNKVNVGGHFDGSTFTAPVSGAYQFTVFGLSENDSSHNDIHITKNGTIYSRHRTAAVSGHKSAANSCIIYLSANDYVQAKIAVSGQSIYGDSGDGWSGFSGHLIG